MGKEEIDHQNDMIGKLTREKKGAQESKQKTEEDIQSMEDRCNHLARLKSKLEQSLDEAEDSLERANRAKAEKSRAILKKDIEDLGSRLEEAGANTATQAELNKKREAELARLKGELEEINIGHEGTLAALR